MTPPLVERPDPRAASLATAPPGQSSIRRRAARARSPPPRRLDGMTRTDPAACPGRRHGQDQPAQRSTGGPCRDSRPGGPLRSEDQTVMSSPANRTALREEENRPAPPSQQVIASAVTGPTPYSRAASTFAPVRLRAASSSRCRSTSRRASSAASMSRAVATCSCPAGDRCAAAAARSACRSCGRCAARPRPAPGRPGGRTPRGCAAPRRCARRAGRGRSPAAPGTPGCRRRDPALRQPALGQQLPQVPRVGLVFSDHYGG